MYYLKKNMEAIEEQTDGIRGRLECAMGAVVAVKKYQSCRPESL